MKRNIFLLMLLFSATTVLFAQQLELKIISQGSVTIPKGFKWSNNFQIRDTVDNYLLCTLIYPTHTYESCLMHKDLSAIRRIELPKEYAKFAPIYMCKVDDHYFFKLQKGFKQYALAIFDEHMNFIKAEPMENVGLVYHDEQYIYLQNAPVKAKVPAAYEGELIKMDKDMNVIIRKPVSVPWNRDTYRPGYNAKDTMGHIIFNNRGTFMTIDRETLGQTKLDLTCALSFEEKMSSSLRDLTLYKADNLIHITFHGYTLSARISDYNGKLLNNQDWKFKTTQSAVFIDYIDDKIYVLADEEKEVSVIEFDVKSGISRIVSSFALDQNPGFKPLGWGPVSYPYTQYVFTCSKWNYEGKSHNILIGTEETKHWQSNSTTCNKFINFIHMDKNFKPIKTKEDVYNDVKAQARVSYKELYTCDDYTLLMQEKPIDKKNSALQFIIWDKSGEIQEIATDIQAPTQYSSISTYAVIHKISPTRYYIFINTDTCRLLELTVK